MGSPWPNGGFKKTILYWLDTLNNIQFLGLQLDSQLTWKMYINYLLNKLSVVSFITRRLFRILNMETLNVVYFAHFHSLIKYGTIFWDNSTTVIKVLIVKKVLRTMLGIDPRSSRESWFVKLIICQYQSCAVFP